MEQDQSAFSNSSDAPLRPSFLGVNSNSSLPRVESTASFTAEACHIEDVDAGCQIHSHPSDIGLSRHNVNGQPLGEETVVIEEEEGQREQSDASALNGDAISHHDPLPPGSPNTIHAPPSINISDANDTERSLPFRPSSPTIDLLQPKPHESAASLLSSSNGLIPRPGSDTDTSRRSSGEINWGFDEMDELLKHETGEFTRENIQAYGEQQGRAISPISRAHTPPEPPKVISKPQPESSSDEDEDEGMEDGLSPFGDEEAAGDEAALLNAIFSQAGAGLPSTQSTQSNSIFDEVNPVNSGDEGSDFFSTLGGDIQGSNLIEQQEAEAQFQEGLPLLPKSHETADDKKSGEERPDTAGPSFFDEAGEYDGGDFFSSAGNPQPPIDLQRKSTSEVMAAAVEGAHHGGVEESETTVIPDIFGTGDETLPEGADFFANPIQSEPITKTDNTTAPTDLPEDIAAKWSAVLASDELLDDDFLPDDGEGFLSDDEDNTAEAAPPPSFSSVGNFNPPTTIIQPATARYAPQTATPPVHSQGPYQPPPQPYGAPATGWQPQPNLYTPMQQPSIPQTPVYNSVPTTTGYYSPASIPSRQFQAAPPKPPLVSKAQSFVDKKGGYQSPYDLPMEVVKPALSKRVSMPHMSASLTSPPPRQSSFGATPPLAQSAFGPPIHNTAVGAPSVSVPPPKASYTPKSAFFEDLPMVAKVRPAKFQPQTAMARSGSLPGAPPRSINVTNVAHQGPTPSLGPALVVNPRNTQNSQAYAVPPPAPRNAPAQYPAVPPTPPTTSHFTPAPATVQAALPPNQGLMSPPQLPPYQRAPSAPLPGTGAQNKYVAKPLTALQQSPPRNKQASVPFNFGADGGDDGSPQQSQQHSPHQMRYFGEQHHLHSSRPGTAKSSNFAAGFSALKEEDEVGETPTATAPPPAAVISKYAPRSTATPPPSSGPPLRGIPRSNTLSPPSRTASPGIYTALQQQNPSRTASPESFAPPRRAQTQSPSMLMNGPKRTMNQYQPSQHVPRPASALAGNAAAAYPVFSPEDHSRSISAGINNFMNNPINFMPPNDPSVHDPLNRWQGCPIFSWGFGGHVVTMFPTRTQRNAVGMSQPMIKCSPGEVKVRHTRDVLPLDNHLVKFPGPVYSGGKGTKSKKKEVLTWMTERIADLEKDATGLGMFLPGEPVPSEAERKKKEEKIFLWKAMKIFLENDGNVEGVEIEKSIRAFLWPEDATPASIDSFSLVASMDSSSTDGGLGPTPDRVDPDAMKTIRSHLLNGDRTAAVWHAVDKRLWSHAMLIAGTVSKDLWKQVVQDFVRNEVKTLGGGLESLAALYEIFGGNGEESMDELVPQSARLGQPMMTSMTGTVSAKNPLEGLEKWRETLALIISNRSAGDTSAILALGKLLATYSRVEAAHLCYLFAKSPSVFSGSDDPNAAVTLFGADHIYSPFTFWKDTDAILLSEVYELALSLAPAPATPTVIPHLQSIKVYHAFLLAESGYRTEAQKYCEAIGSVLKTSAKPSPYFHRTMFNYLEDLTNRVSQSPKDVATGGWLSKPSLDNISGSMWGAFTRFVAGDDNEAGSGAEVGSTPASRPFGGATASPGMSRTQSNADIYGSYGNMAASGGNYSPTMTKQQNPMAAPNPYAPQQQQSQGYTPQPAGSGNPYDSASSYSPYNAVTSSPNAYKPAASQYKPAAQQSAYAPSSQQSPYISQDGYEPSPAKSTFDSPNLYQGSFNSTVTPSDSSMGYQPPSYEPPTGSYGYEPPTNDSPYQPPEAESAPVGDKESEDEKPKPKKKSFMDDDDDADFLARAAALKKEAEKKKKQEEEEDKKQAAAANGGGWFKGWFGGKKEPNAQGGGPIKAKLGEESSFYYDPDLKRWINKKAAPEDQAAPKAAAPPPKRPSNLPPSRPGTAAPPPPLTPSSSFSTGPQKSQSVPPMNTTFPPPTPGSDGPSTPITTTTTAFPPMRSGTPGTPARPPMRAGTPSTPYGPPSRLGTPGPPSTPGTPASLPPTSASAPPPPGPPGRVAPPSRPSTAAGAGGGDSLDDLLGGAAGPRKGGAAGKKGRKGGRYVDVMAK